MHFAVSDNPLAVREALQELGSNLDRKTVGMSRDTRLQRRHLKLMTQDLWMSSGLQPPGELRGGDHSSSGHRCLPPENFMASAASDADSAGLWVSGLLPWMVRPAEQKLEPTL